MKRKKAANKEYNFKGKIETADLQSGKPDTIREWNQASGVRKTYYAQYHLQTGSILLSGTNGSVACGFSPIKIHFSDYPKSLISRINEVYVFLYKILL